MEETRNATNISVRNTKEINFLEELNLGGSEMPWCISKRQSERRMSSSRM
jgi:hypothetical protein